MVAAAPGFLPLSDERLNSKTTVELNWIEDETVTCVLMYRKNKNPFCNLRAKLGLPNSKSVVCLGKGIFSRNRDGKRLFSVHTVLWSHRNRNTVITRWTVRSKTFKKSHLRTLKGSRPHVATPFFQLNTFVLFRMTKELTPQQVLAVRCPTCGAPPGVRCEFGAGQPRTEPHRDRRLLAAEKSGL
jgi:hypothetical protein